MGQTTTHHTQNKVEKDYHGHPNYIKIWGVLVGILVLSLAVGELGHKVLSVTLIFGLALVKAIMVIGNFMHLKWEPKLLTWVMIFAVAALGIFYFGVAPDVVYVEMKIAK
ncbi:MAG: hypothetical protein BroJett040_05880 [Oligoflexia bacterium]|nr:MAG: hypothetical protein BroJett040_05880 [Oligoflexia bacterium]